MNILSFFKRKEKITPHKCLISSADTVFIDTRFGKNKKLFIGQKVQCVYYHERIQYPNTIKAEFFTPVKCGVIIGDAGVRKYYLACGDGTEQYLWVKFKEYIFNKAIPVSCIDDAKESAERTLAFLKKSEHRIGEKGYELDSFLQLENQSKKALKFYEEGN